VYSLVDILLVDDSPAERFLTQAALEEALITNSVCAVDSGVDALAFLRKTGKYVGAKRPNLILLDLNMPGMDGREVLREIKKDPDLCTIPVIVLTSSGYSKDVAAAYAEHANGYITKPVDFNNFCEAMKSLKSFWFQVVTLPEQK
jgi:CheY-like chemotaxis protein